MAADCMVRHPTVMKVGVALALSSPPQAHSRDHEGHLARPGGFLQAMLHPGLALTGWRGNHVAPNPCQSIRNLILIVEVFFISPQIHFHMRPSPPVSQEGTDVASD